jgi:SAM-dependent methyltransferase
MTTATTPEFTILSRVTDPPLELYTTEGAFRPNPTTVRFGRAVRVTLGDIVFDIGTGIGPLAIKAALDGAGEVHGVDPVEIHCVLARRNVAKYGLQGRVTIHEGRFFEPFREGTSRICADVIIGDISGIADPVAHALGWYSRSVPAGGPDGAEQIVAMLAAAGEFLRPGGTLYFPVAVDLSDQSRIMEAAASAFGSIENALDKPFIEFPLAEQEVRAIHDAYAGSLPGYIHIQQGRRPYWRGQIFAASRPR